ncbi:TetR/AcrR family transcriptional regulator [Chimaeribacter californicus]|uniref:TetR/AcrR family transcriptional regulator n=1 Tax=Chimaeribacter californicus TaxID=2060067 RepID=A0A2N5DXE9_9GAMM|nr:TetR/AcrR family transcriptional regulator [Chimaeribacter californicus]PLR32047.1 TetR/AcrR family transcriptional regulator [Chimaeribacter californicus]
MSTENMALAKKCRGRPKQFDRDDALNKALKLFWKYGYEATSLADLVEATGAKAPTLYAEFGNKEGLFRAAVEHYLTLFVETSNRALMQSDVPLRQSIEEYLRAAAALFTDCDNPSGCFMVCTSATLSAASEEIASMLRSRHHLQEETLSEFLDSKKETGELSPQVSSRILAKYLNCTVQGMSVQARDGASRAELNQLVDVVMAIWPQLIAFEAQPVTSA